MHYHCEIIMPPTNDVEAAIKSILAPFDENAEGDESSGHAFWDWYVIGGRWSGAKIEARCGADRIEAFSKELTERGVTVSGLQWGKQELSPASQQDAVDALWRERFPNSGLMKCPLFKHAGDQLPDDVCRLADVPLDMPCSRLIIAGPAYKDGIEASFMIQDSTWNGVTHVESNWSGKFGDALAMCAAKFEHYTEEWRAKHLPQPDWIVVTVDYHS